MLRSHQLITTCLAIIASGLTTASAAGEPRHAKEALAVASASPTRSGEVVETTDLQPFTHIAYIPVGADLSSSKIEEIKPVKVATRRRSETNPRDCFQTWSDPGGSMYCPHTVDESYMTAYRVTYSFRAQPMASDEYANEFFTFSVYFHPGELSPELRQLVSAGKLRRAAALELFRLTSSRDFVEQVVVDETNSNTCDGNYIDGNWTQTNPTCEEHVAFRRIVSVSPYITVKVDLAPSRL
jgi:hypothetical protein